MKSNYEIVTYRKDKHGNPVISSYYVSERKFNEVMRIVHQKEGEG